MLNELLVRAYASLLSFGRDEEGASAVEYGLILGLIAVAIVGILLTMKVDLVALFTGAASGLATANQ